MSHSLHATGAAAAQINVAVHRVIGAIGGPTFVLRNRRLDNAKMHAGDQRIRFPRKPDRAIANVGEEQRHGDSDSDAARTASHLAVGDEEGRRREDEEGRKRHAPDADERCGLHHERCRCQRVAEGIPREPCEEVAAQPFGHRHRAGEDEKARPTVEPEGARHRRADCPEEREERRQGDHGQRQRPCKSAGVDEERRADPPETRDKEAEAESEADNGGRENTAEPGRTFTCLGAIDQPDENRHGQPKNRKRKERRERQRRGRSSEESDGKATPAPLQNDGVG